MNNSTERAMQELYILETCEGDTTITLNVFSEPTDTNNPYEMIEFRDTLTGAKFTIARYEFESASKRLNLIKLKG